MDPTVVPADDFEYSTDYVDWLSYDAVNHHLNRLIGADPHVRWLDWFGATHGTFRRALSINCGDGWVERALFELGVIGEVVGIDLAEDALVRAKQEAEAIGLPAEYVAMDVNRDDLPSGPFDLVINHAALHHVAYIDRMARSLHEVMAPDGRIVQHDYTGPHRNQYDTAAWAATLDLNESLPADLRHDGLCYPHLPTMLSVDPTEAVHSELILETLQRYFEPETLVALGGAIAYQLLHQHPTLHQRQHDADGAAVLARIIEADVGYTGGDPTRALFTFAVWAPKAGALDDAEQLERWTAEEVARERDAADRGNEYYPRTAFGLVYRDLADAQMQALHAIKTLELEREEAMAPPARPGLGERLAEIAHRTLDEIVGVLAAIRARLRRR